MRNQPGGPGCFLSGVVFLCIFGTVKLSRLPVIGLGENGFSLGWLLVADGAAMLLAMGIVIISQHIPGESGEIDESGDIVTMTWTLANYVGMDNAQDLRFQVAELKYPDTNNGIWHWKPGHSMASFEALALDKGLKCRMMTANELINKDG